MALAENNHTPAVPPELDLNKRSFPTAYVAAVLGVTPQAVNKRASSRRWEAAPEKTQGGGSLWLFKHMDKEAQHKISHAVLTEYHARMQPNPELERKHAAKWEEFDKKPMSIKERAMQRQSLLLEVLELHHAGTTLKVAFDAIALRHDVSAATLRNWYFGAGGKQGVRNIDPKDWLPYLADNHKGRVARAECHETAWEFIKKDYLRKEKPSFMSCFRRLSLAADAHYWAIPSARTLYRRIFEAFTWAVIEMMRTGKLHNTYPDQERRRDTFPVGYAVSGDALSFDKIKVYDEVTGEVFSPRTWFFEDIHSGKILAGDTDKTENGDMFRRALYNLTEQLLPRYMCIDNTTAASNKCMTGQITGRKRFRHSLTDPVGILKLLQIETHFTNPDHDVASPGSKPIERAFGIGGLHSSMRELPALKGRGTTQNPIPYSEFKVLLAQVVAEHNSRKGRTGGICNGRSFDEVYAEGLRHTSLRQASPELRRLLLCSQESCRVSSQGTVTLKAGRGQGKHRYFAEFLVPLFDNQVAVFFNPDKLSDGVTVYDLSGKLLGAAKWLPTVAFNDTTKSREHAKHKRRHAKLVKQAAQEATHMTDLEFEQLNVAAPASEKPIPERTVTMLGPSEIREMLNPSLPPSTLKRLNENLRNNLAAMA